MDPIVPFGKKNNTLARHAGHMGPWGAASARHRQGRRRQEVQARSASGIPEHHTECDVVLQGRQGKACNGAFHEISIDFSHDDAFSGAAQQPRLLDWA